jgi:hypothetical protein
MSTVDLEAKIPNNVGLRDNKRLMMALEKWQPKFLEWWKTGPTDFNRTDDLPAHGGRRRPGRLGALRLREDARLPLGHLPRRRPAPIARSTSATTSASRPGRRCPASSAIAAPPDRHAGRHRARVGRAAAHARPLLPVALRPALAVPGQRRRRPPPVGDGLPAADALRRRRPRRGRSDARTPQRRQGQPAHPAGVQLPGDQLAGLLLLHGLHGPRRQVPARVARRVELRPARAQHAVHARRRGLPPADRRERRRPHRQAHRRADGEGARTRARSARSRSTSSRSTSTSGSRLDGPVRWRGLDQRRRVVRERA